MLVNSFNISQSFNYTPHLFKKQFKTEINCFCTYMDPVFNMTKLQLPAIHT